jgi:hypothetical protein
MGLGDGLAVESMFDAMSIMNKNPIMDSMEPSLQEDWSSRSLRTLSFSEP